MKRKENNNNDPPCKRLKYDENQLKTALDEIKSGMSIHKASTTYKIPFSTLRDKFAGKTPQKIMHPGFYSFLGKEIEEKIVKWVLLCAKQGFAVDKKMLLDNVQKIVNKHKITTPFINGRPGNKWFYKFLKRHPEIAQKHAEYINRARGSVTEKSIRDWFKEVEELLGEDFDALKDPSRVWNKDETNFQLCPKSKLVLGERGKTVYNESSKSNKENITTLFSVNAEGLFSPPLTLYKFERIPKRIIDAAPDYWGIGKSENGWMTSETFYEDMANVFIPFIKEKQIKLPIVVFLDGHTSHLSMELSDLCIENQIHLVALPPNATHICQPLDVAVFGPLKAKWKQIVRDFRIEHDGKEINKEDIPKALEQIIKDPKMKDNIISGFKATGIFPFTPENVDFSKIVLRGIPNTDEPINDSMNQNTQMDHQRPANFLKTFESVLDPIVLHMFRASGSFWDGDIEYSKLFEVWNKIKNREYEIQVYNNEEEPVQHTQGASNDEVETCSNWNDSMNAVTPSSNNERFVNSDAVYRLLPPMDYNQATPVALDTCNETRNTSSAPVYTELSSLNNNVMTVPNLNNVPFNTHLTTNAPFSSLMSPSDHSNVITLHKPTDLSLNTNDKTLSSISIEDTNFQRKDSLSNFNSSNIIKKSPVSDIDEIVFWPKQPTKKGKKTTERLPTVLTCDKWRAAKLKQINEKQEKEEKKQLRKQEIAKRKEEKLKQQAEKKKSKQQAENKKNKQRKKNIKQSQKENLFTESDVSDYDDYDDNDFEDEYYRELKNNMFV